MSSDAPGRTIETSSHAITDWIYGISNFRKNEIVFENITYRNMWSSGLIFCIWINEPNTNITLRNVSAYNIGFGTV